MRPEQKTKLSVDAVAAEIGPAFAKDTSHMRRPDEGLDPGHKRCRRCDRVLTIESFSGNRRNLDGLQPNCRDCRSAERAAYTARKNFRKWCRTGGYEA